jgi:hypothetical protein
MENNKSANGDDQKISPLLKSLIAKGFDPNGKYSIVDIYGKFMQKATGRSKWGTLAHRNTTGATVNEDSIPYNHKVGVDASGRKYVDTNFEAWPDHPKGWNVDPLGTTYTSGTYMEFYRAQPEGDFEFVGFSGGKDSLEKIDENTIRMYLQW